MRSGRRAVPVLQRDLPGRRGLGPVGPVCDRPPVATAAARGGVELAAVLALQVLGGDPEAAYLTVVCGAGYAVVLAIRARDRPSPLLTGPALGGVCALGRGDAGPGFCPSRFASVPGDERLSSRPGWPSVWGRVALAPLSGRRPAGTALAGLAGACILAMALAAVQVLPVLEFAGQSRRVAGESRPTSTISASTLFRVVELVWPNVFGTNSPRESLLAPGRPARGRPRALDRLALYRRLDAGPGPRCRGMEIAAAPGAPG